MNFEATARTRIVEAQRREGREPPGALEDAAVMALERLERGLVPESERERPGPEHGRRGDQRAVEGGGRVGRHAAAATEHHEAHR